MTLELHLFTNCTSTAPSTEIIRQTYHSFVDAFGEIPVGGVWVDQHPNSRQSMKYRENLLLNFRTVKFTTGLSDGYIKAVKNSRADYLFMLEHDWIFKTELIKHGIFDIIEMMKKEKIYHFRFNKRDNVLAGWDKKLEPQKTDGIKWCRTNILSNNPHIIAREPYIDFIRKRYVTVRAGSKGIEEIISAMPDTWGGIYGPLGYPATVWHTDGRRVTKRRRR